MKKRIQKTAATLLVASLCVSISPIASFASTNGEAEPETDVIEMESEEDAAEALQAEPVGETVTEAEADAARDGAGAEPEAEPAEAEIAEEAAEEAEPAQTAEPEEAAEDAAEEAPEENGEAEADEADVPSLYSAQVEEDVTFGFRTAVISSTDTFKYERYNSRNHDGSNTYEIYFFCDAEEDWIDANITFEVRDVTSNGIISVMEDAGIAYSAPVTTVGSAAPYLKEMHAYSYYPRVSEPFGEDGPDIYTLGPVATSGKVITVDAGMSTRYLKVTAYMDGEVADYAYLISDGNMIDDYYSYSDQDQALFERACAAIEEQIWTDGMSNLEKLQAFADYIKSVSHYPDSDTTKAEYNPEWAARWGVDGSTSYHLIWWNFADKYMDWTMALEGGQSTCLAANMLYYIAQNHLGLKGISYEDTGAGEGVYVGTGSLSSNKNNGSHSSLVYQAADGTRTFVDAQGMSYSSSSSNVTCGAHGCQSQIIPISSYSGSGSAPDQSEEVQDDKEDPDDAEVQDDKEDPDDAEVQDDEEDPDDAEVRGGGEDPDDEGVQDDKEDPDDAEVQDDKEDPDDAEVQDDKEDPDDEGVQGGGEDPDDAEVQDDKEDPDDEETQDVTGGSIEIPSGLMHLDLTPDHVTLQPGTSQTLSPVLRLYSLEYPDGMEIEYAFCETSPDYLEGYLIAEDEERIELTREQMADLVRCEFTEDGAIRITAGDLDPEYAGASVTLQLTAGGDTYWAEEDQEWEMDISLAVTLENDAAAAADSDAEGSDEEGTNGEDADGEGTNAESSDEEGTGEESLSEEDGSGEDTDAEAVNAVVTGEEDAEEEKDQDEGAAVISDNNGNDYTDVSGDGNTVLEDVGNDVVITDNGNTLIQEFVDNVFPNRGPGLRGEEPHDDGDPYSETESVWGHPKTGDSSAALFYLVLAAAACAGVAGVVIFRRRRIN